MSNPSRPRKRKFTEARRRHLIAVKMKFAEEWQTDEEAMLRRCAAGGKATAEKAAKRRETLVAWLSTMPPRMTKAQIVREFELRMNGATHVKARSLIEKMRLYGKLRYEAETGLWMNVDKC
jgi:hypothetical protein